MTYISDIALIAVLGAAGGYFASGASCGFCSQGHSGHQRPAPNPETKETKQVHDAHLVSGASFPLATCVVDGTVLASASTVVAFHHDGRLVRVCSQECEARFKREPTAYVDRLDQAVVAAQKPSYPLSTCPVSGKELGAMGEPKDIVVDNRLVRLCCAMCAGAVRNDPRRVIDKIDAAVFDAQAEKYPLATCPVSGKTVGGRKAIDYIHGTRLIRLCSPECVKQVEKDPPDVLRRIDAARPHHAEEKGKTPQQPQDQPGHDAHKGHDSKSSTGQGGCCGGHR